MRMISFDFTEEGIDNIESVLENACEQSGLGDCAFRSEGRNENGTYDVTLAVDGEERVVEQFVNALQPFVVA